MEDMIIKEGVDILRKLSPKNQTYFMTLLRLAEVAEEGAKKETKICKSKKQAKEVVI